MSSWSLEKLEVESHLPLHILKLRLPIWQLWNSLLKNFVSLPDVLVPHEVIDVVESRLGVLGVICVVEL